MIRLGPDFPDPKKRVLLCHNPAGSIVWLELTNTETIVDGAGSDFVTVFIGAYSTPKGWVAIDKTFADANRDTHYLLGNEIGDRIGMFQRAICRDWRGFSSSTASRYAKGLTFGRDLSSPSFVLKALKTGFEAAGVSISTYEGFRRTGFTLADVLDYLKTRGKSLPPPDDNGSLYDFIQVGADPAGEWTEDKPVKNDERRIKLIETSKTATHGGRFAYANETREVPFTRVITYGFRGDTRNPQDVKAAGGFNPNYTRPDHIATAKTKNKPDDQALNLPAFLNAQFYGGYISVSKSYAITKAFASNQMGTAKKGGRPGGWVYACLVEGGFDIPKAGNYKTQAFGSDPQKVINVPYNEQELAMPGLLDWVDVVACRRVSENGRFTGNIYLRKSFIQEDHGAAMDVYRLLSGASQGKH